MSREDFGNVALRVSPNKQEAALIFGPDQARFMLSLCCWLPGFVDVSKALAKAIKQMEEQP